MKDYGYRLWLIQQAATSIFPPVALIFGVGRLTGISFALGTPVFLGLLIAPLFWWLTARLAELYHADQASKLGAGLLPVIRGRKFAGVDLIQRYACHISLQVQPDVI